jgi:hypothetical protein
MHASSFSLPVATHCNKFLDRNLSLYSKEFIMEANISSQSPIRVGVLILSEGVQLLDTAAVDLLGCMDPKYLEVCQFPAAMVAKGVECEFHYISEDGTGPARMTAGMKCVVTVGWPIPPGVSRSDQRLTFLP